ncbi:MAG: DUF4923 family protein [Prevotella sp.]|jgi:uncharacterized lipoprotein YehR (DUF1307 family)|nr:DUF4923 family protein [Prevotella sp.]
MKKHSILTAAKTTLAASVVALTMSGCGTIGTSQGGTDILGSILGAATDGNTITNVITSVLGADKVSEKALIGTWRYSSPGCAFTSDNLLAKAGGEVAATEVKNKLQTYYSQIGISSSNTYITFGEDKSFSGKIDGKSVKGTYVYDQKSGQITLKTLLFSANGYVKRNGMSGIGLLFESKKMLTLLQTVAAMSGNSGVQTIGDLSKNYDGVRVGFDMTK